MILWSLLLDAMLRIGYIEQYQYCIGSIPSIWSTKEKSRSSPGAKSQLTSLVSLHWHLQDRRIWFLVMTSFYSQSTIIFLSSSFRLCNSFKLRKYRSLIHNENPNFSVLIGTKKATILLFPPHHLPCFMHSYSRCGYKLGVLLRSAPIESMCCYIGKMVNCTKALLY